MSHVISTCISRSEPTRLVYRSLLSYKLRTCILYPRHETQREKEVKEITHTESPSDSDSDPEPDSDSDLLCSVKEIEKEKKKKTKRRILLRERKKERTKSPADEVLDVLVVSAF